MSSIALSGWGQPHDVLSGIAPDAVQVDYAATGSMEAALDTLEGYADAHTVIGWSMGGQLAVKAVAEGILKPKKLVLIATPFHFVRGAGAATMQKFRDNYRRDPARTLDKAYALIAHGDTRGGYIEPQLQAARARVPGHDWLYWLDTLSAAHCDGMDFKAFPPTALLHGDRDVVVGPAQSQAFEQALPRARLHVFAGCGHAPHWYDAARVRKIISGGGMKELAQNVQHDFGRAAGTYDAHAQLQREVLQAAAQLLAQVVPGNAQVLDAGCGTGALAECDIPPWGIFGVDIAAPMCAVAAQRGVQAVCADIQHLPLKDACVDAALCSLALQWVENRAAAFAELCRVIPPGGYAAITLFGSQTLRELRDTLGDAHVHTFPTLAIIARQAEAAGWDCARHQSQLFTHQHQTLAELMHSLKAIGATNKLSARRRGLTTLSTFRRAEARYRERFGGIRATWEVHTLLLQKPRL